jgi:hypothetical protein
MPSSLLIKDAEVRVKIKKATLVSNVAFLLTSSKAVLLTSQVEHAFQEYPNRRY